MGIGLVWGTLIAGIAISLLLAGGLKAVQTATIVFALPFTLVIVLMVIALWRALRQDWSEHVVRERELRRRMRRMVET
ncbi:BCCT family transporter [Massilia niastensis]|uniref:BCCT family transporter n=1 Tax=Massilia niastensis TaxID=544911 RepID=UPI001E6205E9|nr:BCCT family transporter [Massilia niastensis]